MKKDTGIWLVAIVVVGGLMFFAGTKYSVGQSTANNFMGQTAGGQGQGQGGARRNVQGGRGGAMGGFTTGEVLSKDDKSITLKLNSGGSKLIFLTSSTKVMKSTEGAMTDLKVGDNVSTNGTPNADSSINAESVQIRPAMPTTSTKQ